MQPQFCALVLEVQSTDPFTLVKEVIVGRPDESEEEFSERVRHYLLDAFDDPDEERYAYVIEQITHL